MKHCEGCYTNWRLDGEDEGGTRCVGRQWNAKGECPCSNCIIKVMCRDSCHLFTEWRHERYERTIGEMRYNL